MKTLKVEVVSIYKHGSLLALLAQRTKVRCSIIVGSLYKTYDNRNSITCLLILSLLKIEIIIKSSVSKINIITIFEWQNLMDMFFIMIAQRNYKFLSTKVHLNITISKDDIHPEILDQKVLIAKWINGRFIYYLKEC